MGIVSKKIGIIIAGIIIGFLLILPIQVIAPFPLGLYLGIVVWILVAVIFLVIALVLVRPSMEGKSPKSILEERYAKGKITKEEFDKMKKDLEG